MLEKKYKNIVYFIGVTIVITIAVQIYWNAKIFDVNKQQLINQIQVSFDTSVESYYNQLAKENIFTVYKLDSLDHNNHKFDIRSQPNVNRVWAAKFVDTVGEVNQFKIISDSIIIGSEIIRDTNFIHLQPISNNIVKDSSLKLEFRNINNVPKDLTRLTRKVLFAFQNESIELDKIDSLFKIDLSRKKIDLNYSFLFSIENPITNKITTEKYNIDNATDNIQLLNSNSDFIPIQSKLQLFYSDLTVSILKRMYASILLSLILSISIIGCLLFLLKTIFKQKQLSAVKNDFINNITHELKTPISTISIALEGLENFDIIKDETKKKKYLSISRMQLGKLNNMVEKILETATLKTDQFELNKEPINLSELIKNITKKLNFSDSDKSISLLIDDNINYNVDPFHFENALNNILDNAFKYGGNQIIVRALSTKNNIEITIEDNGDGIDDKHKQKIFEQFYRIPTGNVHNVKGFGIGLYYTKNIIEKHRGNIYVSENKKGKIVFKISLPYGR